LKQNDDKWDDQLVKGREEVEMAKFGKFGKHSVRNSEKSSLKLLFVILRFKHK
jgi:hypothetical protein